MRKFETDPSITQKHGPADHRVVDQVAKLDHLAKVAKVAGARLSMETDFRAQAALQMEKRATMHSPSAFADATGLAGVAREAERLVATKRAVSGSELAALAMLATSQDRLFAPQMRASLAAWEFEKSARWPSSVSMADTVAARGDSASLAASALFTGPSFVSVAAEESRRTAAARMVEAGEQRMAADLAFLNAELRRQERLKPRVVNVTPHGAWNNLELHELSVKLESSPRLVPCDCNPCELFVFKTTSDIGDAQLLKVTFACDGCGSVKETVRWPELIEAGRGLRLLPVNDDDSGD